MRRPMVATLSVVALLALAGCGSGGDAGADAERRLTYWATNMATSVTDDEDVLRPLLETFTEQTGIEVDLEVVPWDSLWNRILTAVGSGQGPDVLNIGNTWSASLQATGALLEFDDAAMDAIGGADKFIATSLASTGAPGEPPAAVPLYGQSYGLYYNTDLFAAAGLTEPPSTWDQFVDTAKQLTQDTDGDGEIDQWGMAVLGGAGLVGVHFAFILGQQHGGALFDADGTPQFDSDEQVAAVRRYLDLMATDRVVAPGNAEFTRTEASAQFADGRAAMLIAQSTTRGLLADLGFTAYAVAPVPVLSPLPPGGRDVQTMVAGINVAVLEASDDQEAALELVEYLTSADVQITANGAYGTLPVVTEAYEIGDYGDESTQVFAAILRDHAEPFPQIPEVGQMETLIGGVMKELFARAATGTVTDDDIRSALAAANSQMIAAR